MYLAGVSVRRVEDIIEALWGSKVSPSTISELNKKAYVHIENWRNRPLQGGRYPYVYVDGIYLRCNWGGEFENVAILVAIAVNEDGYHEVLGAAEGMKEDKASWVSFFQWLRGCGLDGVKLVVGDKCLGMLEAVGEVFLEAKYQRTVHFYCNVFSVTPRSMVKLVAKMLMPPRCAARPADMYADHSLRLAQEIVTENFFLCLLRQKRKGGGKFRMVQNGGLAACSKKIFFKLLRLGKLDKLLVHQIVKGNLPLPFPAKLQNLIAGSIADYCLTKGVVLALDVLLIGFKVGHGNSPSLNNSAGRQHSLLSPLDCLSAKAGGAVNGGAVRAVHLDR